MVSVWRHVQDPTSRWRRILGAQRRHQCVPGSCACATYAVAFIRYHAPVASQPALVTSEGLQLRSWWLGGRVSTSPASRPCWVRNTPFVSVLFGMVRCLAASGAVNSRLNTSCTACTRNSYVNVYRDNHSMPHLQTPDHRVKASTLLTLPQS